MRSFAALAALLLAACVPSLDGLAGGNAGGRSPDAEPVAEDEGHTSDVEFPADRDAEAEDADVSLDSPTDDAQADANETGTDAPLDADGEAGQPDGGDQLDPKLVPIGAPTDSVFLAWLLDEGSGVTARDAHGHLRDGTLINAPGWRTTSPDLAPTSRSTNLGSLYFDATNRSVSYVDTSPQAYPYSIGLWIKSFSTSDGIIFTRRDVTTGQIAVQLRIVGRNFEHYVNDGSASGGCSSAGTCLTSSTTVQSNVWYHVTITGETGHTAHLYVNGAEESSRTIGNIQNLGGRYDLGAEPNRAIAPLKGVVDEVFVYRRMLKQGEIIFLASP